MMKLSVLAKTSSSFRYPELVAYKSQVKSIYLIVMLLVIVLSIIGIQNKLYLKTDLLTVYIMYIILGLSNVIVTQKGITWDKIVGWSFFAYSVGVPLYLLTDGGLEGFIGTKMYFNEVYTFATVSESLYYNCLFVSLFYFSYFIFNKKVSENLEENTVNGTSLTNKKYNYFHSRFFIHYWILIAVGLFLFGMYKINYLSAISAGYSLKNVGYVYLFTAVFAIDIGTLILFRMTNFEKKYLLIAGIFHLLLFPLGIRQLTFTFIFQLALLYKLANYQRKIKVKGIILGISLLLFFGLIGMVRKGGEQAFSFISLLKAPIRYFFYETTFNYISFLKCLELFKEHSISYLYGKTLLDPIVEQIPSFILSNKNNYQFFERFIMQYESLENLKPVGTAHLLTELYVNGGMIFVIIFSLIIGLVSSILNNKLWKVIATNNFIGQILFSAIIPFVFIQLNRGGLSVLTKLSFQFAILPVLIVLMFRRKI
ncbi:O-antigen polysaccharide polymerase Wzy [Paenibacillus uliginis N3/975]|uniref:O-antigen polysaccharide polymerase Wzy n=2 Tax=Paenibacillus TaxID=44249 RepID=A0A1X7HSH5_9BACL|nr:O-antigen polysaccharide polymerase Wzy [Paenibacillus uliginis N3/975]